MTDAGRAVVIVSGGDAISPFTTSEDACRVGLAAGSTDSALRESLLAAGLTVFTSPATAGDGPVTVDPGFGGFAQPPEQLPAELTVNSVGPIDVAAVHLAAFLRYLAAEHDAVEVDLVGHSMGGLFSRGAIRELAHGSGVPTVRSLTTIGTPWEGAFAADYVTGDVSLADAASDPSTETIMTEFRKQIDALAPGASGQVTRRFLTDPGRWNDQQAGILDSLPLTLIAGDHFRIPGGSDSVWPHDGLVTLRSALATSVSVDVLPAHSALTFPDVHSLFIADAFQLAHERALSWDPEVHQAVLVAIAAVPSSA